MSVVLLSGGIDSAVCLALNPNAYALTVDYGQRHRREITAAADIATHYSVPHKIVTVDPALFVGSALTDSPELLPDYISPVPDATYVPARNTVLLALASAYAETLSTSRVVIGCNKDDADAYPDCRSRYIEAFRDVITEGTTHKVWIEAPLLYKTKTEIIQLAHSYDVPLDLTWSCYVGGETPCGQCGACQLREAATA